MKSDIATIRASKLISISQFFINGILSNVGNMISAIYGIVDYCRQEDIQNIRDIIASLKYSFFFGIEEKGICKALDYVMSEVFNDDEIKRLSLDLTGVYEVKYGIDIGNREMGAFGAVQVNGGILGNIQFYGNHNDLIEIRDRGDVHDMNIVIERGNEVNPQAF
jgi:hypothetical protein